MPHLIMPRPRVVDPLKPLGLVSPRALWDAASALLYLVGGAVFMVRSVLFMPRFEALANVGAWTFFGGSLVYLVVIVHDLVEVIGGRLHPDADRIEKPFELPAVLSYLAGTLLFTVGSIFFLSEVGAERAGAWCFISGSVLFVLAACINVLQIVTARSFVLLFFMNLTTVSFVAGSVLFTVASIPYLWTFASPQDEERVAAFLAWQYLAGSALFFLGGVFDARRAAIVVERAIDQRRAASGRIAEDGAS